MDDVVICCGAVVYRFHPDLQILLVKQRKDDVGWGIPKGHMEKGESFKETALREVKEETGINVRIVNKLPYAILKKKNFRKIVIPYLAVQTCSSKPKSSSKASEVVDVKWFDVNSLPPIYSYQQQMVDAALVILSNL